MSVNSNPDSVPAGTQFKSKVARSQPMTTKGHQPGVMVGKDAIPDTHLTTHPPGTAPEADSFRPDPVAADPGRTDNPDVPADRRTAADSFAGATSADVHAGLGKPVSGSTSSEAHGGKREKERSGLEGVGTSAADNLVAAGGRESNPENWPAAEGRVPRSAEQIDGELTKNG